MALSWLTRLRRSSATLVFSKLAKVLNASLTSVSTFAVALVAGAAAGAGIGTGALGASAGGELLVTTTLDARVSFTESRLASDESACPETEVAAVEGSTAFGGDAVRPWEGASERAI